MDIENQIINDEINWELFSSNYVRLFDGEPVDLVLESWRQTEEEYKGEKSAGIRVDVLEENGVKVKKVLVITSRRLASAIKPIIVNAEKMSEQSIKVRILKTGTGFNTQYNVKQL